MKSYLLGALLGTLLISVQPWHLPVPLGRGTAHACGEHTYWARGTIHALDVAHHTLMVAHEPIVGLMGAATTRFHLLDAKRLGQLRVGDVVVFEFETHSDGRHIVSRIDRIALRDDERG